MISSERFLYFLRHASVSSTYQSRKTDVHLWTQTNTRKDTLRLDRGAKEYFLVYKLNLAPDPP